MPPIPNLPASLASNHPLQPPRGAESRRLLQQDGSSSGDSSGTDSSSDSSSDDSSSDSSGSPSAALSSSRAANTFVPEGGKGDWESGIDVGEGGMVGTWHEQACSRHVNAVLSCHSRTLWPPLQASS